MKKLKKIPIQIYLDPDQEKVIGMLAKEQGKSKAAVIRLCIKEYLSRLPVEKDPIMNILALGSSNKNDISEKHDDYLTKQ